MNNLIEIINSNNVVEINIEGTIGVPEEWQFEKPDDRVATYEKFRESVIAIRAIKAGNVIVNIRSTGGSVNDALLIFDALKEIDAKITTRCYGYTASAATIIAQAASEGCREMSPNALYLIHRSIATSEGNAEALEEVIDLLKQTDKRIASIYASRSGREVSEFEVLMANNNGDGRWLSADEAIEYGLVDYKLNEKETFNFISTNKNSKSMIKNIYDAVRSLLGWKPEAEAPEVEITDAEVATLNQHILDGESREEGLRTQLAEAQSQVADLTANNVDLTSQLQVETQAREIVESELKRYKVKPTEVSDVEDPALGDESHLSANERAYQQDALNFKK